MGRNAEIKAWYPDLGKARGIILGLGGSHFGTSEQVDTYLAAKTGRLKVRSHGESGLMELIQYERADSLGPKSASFIVERITEAAAEILCSSLPVKTVVRKRREIYFIGNAKFQLDTLRGLGTFVEIEVIDLKDSVPTEELQEKLSHFVSLLGIETTDLISCSYSDIMMVGGLLAGEFRDSGAAFSLVAAEKLRENSIDVSGLFCDHLCYRVESIGEYERMKIFLRGMGDLLTEALVGGRPIATFKLREPLQTAFGAVDLIELPQPKPGSFYRSGFEHAEFVILETLESFVGRHVQVRWDLEGAKKTINPDVSVELRGGISCKFHREGLEEVIAREKAQKPGN